MLGDYLDLPVVQTFINLMEPAGNLKSVLDSDDDTYSDFDCLPKAPEVRTESWDYEAQSRMIQRASNRSHSRMRCALPWNDYLFYGTLQTGKTSPTSSCTYSIGCLALGNSDDKTSEQVEILKALLRTKHAAIRPCD